MIQEKEIHSSNFIVNNDSVVKSYEVLNNNHQIEHGNSSHMTKDIVGTNSAVKNDSTIDENFTTQSLRRIPNGLKVKSKSTINLFKSSSGVHSGGGTSCNHRHSLQLKPLDNNSRNAIEMRNRHSRSWYGRAYGTLKEEVETDLDGLTAANKSIKSQECQDELNPLLSQIRNDVQSKVMDSQRSRSVSCFQLLNPLPSQKPFQCNYSDSSSVENLITRKKRLQNILKSLLGRKDSKSNINSVSLSSSSEESLFEPKIICDRNLLPGIHSKYSFSEKQLLTTNVLTNLRRESSASSVRSNNYGVPVKLSKLRKSETVVTLSHVSDGSHSQLWKSLPFSKVACSRCSSVFSLGVYDSKTLVSKNIKAASQFDSSFHQYVDKINWRLCKLCLSEVYATTTIEACGCVFCTQCMKTYVEFEISQGAYEISCPDAQCPSKGTVSLDEIKMLGTSNSVLKFKRYQLNHEIETDKKRTWCPRAGCETICIVEHITNTCKSIEKLNEMIRCPTCHEEFCSACLKNFHPNITCEENSVRVEDSINELNLHTDDGSIKRCPMCAILIEKDEGCAQMMCKRCKHVFCWYCLTSLDDDFLLRHYDKGPCKNKLGHTRASVVWHRIQVVGIFAGFGVLLLVASPLLLLAAPCIICCKCRMCSGSSEAEKAMSDE